MDRIRHGAWLASLVERAVADLPDGAGAGWVLGRLLGACRHELGDERTAEILLELARRAADHGRREPAAPATAAARS